MDLALHAIAQHGVLSSSPQALDLAFDLLYQMLREQVGPLT
jgi:hypothetical protein